jgi:biotin carboxyl carrier protein
VKVELEIGDRLRTVEIQRRAGGFHVSVDGRLRFIDAAHVTASSWSLLIRDADGQTSRSVEATVLPQNGNGGFEVHIDGFTIPVLLKGGLGRRTRDLNASAAGRGVGPQFILAPMPGRVLRVLVNAGDEIKARQGLVVVEAMKMENELRSPKAGRVKDVAVTPGTSVEAGRVLVVIE